MELLIKDSSYLLCHLQKTPMLTSKAREGKREDVLLQGHYFPGILHLLLSKSSVRVGVLIVHMLRLTSTSARGQFFPVHGAT